MNKNRDEVTRHWRQRVRAYVRELLIDDPTLLTYQILELADEDGVDCPYKDAWWKERISETRAELGIKIDQSEGQRLRQRRLRERLSERDQILKQQPKHSQSAEFSVDACKRLASAMVECAVRDAGFSGDPTSRAGIKARAAAAWLQSPEATDLWCWMAGVDPDVVAEISERRHGRPRFRQHELEYLRGRGRS